MTPKGLKICSKTRFSSWPCCYSYGMPAEFECLPHARSFLGTSGTKSLDYGAYILPGKTINMRRSNSVISDNGKGDEENTECKKAPGTTVIKEKKSLPLIKPGDEQWELNEHLWRADSQVHFIIDKNILSHRRETNYKFSWQDTERLLNAPFKEIIKWKALTDIFVTWVSEQFRFDRKILESNYIPI